MMIDDSLHRQLTYVSQYNMQELNAGKVYMLLFFNYVNTWSA
jgi:hypothetical protein